MNCTCVISRIIPGMFCNVHFGNSESIESAVEKPVEDTTSSSLPLEYIGLREEAKKAEDYAARVMKERECPGS